MGQETKKIEIPDEIVKIADQRIQAKQEKDYALADELRNKIQDLGYQMQDTKN